MLELLIQRVQMALQSLTACLVADCLLEVTVEEHSQTAVDPAEYSVSSLQ